MIRSITYITIVFLLFISNVNAQEKSFEQKIKSLSIQLENVVKTEKDLLRKEIRAIEKQYNNDKITFEEAEKQKAASTKLHADNIKKKTTEIESKVHGIVQGKVDVKVAETKEDSKKEFSFTYNKKDRAKRKDKRTNSYLVFALGANNLMKGGLNSIQDSEFKFGASHFYEVGLNYKTRLLKNSGLLYFNYGLSLRYNNLRAKKNQFLIVDGKDTKLENYPVELKDSRFKTVQLVAPLFFEFDFSKSKKEKEKTIYRRNRSFRLGFGAFAGINIKSKQYLEYDKNGIDTEIVAKGDYNVNKFVYGLQGLVGYKDVSLYIKYDLQDTFSDSFTDQKNISLGLRFDL